MISMCPARKHKNLNAYLREKAIRLAISVFLHFACKPLGVLRHDYIPFFFFLTNGKGEKHYFLGCFIFISEGRIWIIPLKQALSSPFK